MLKMEKVDINFRMLQMDQLVVEYLAYRGLNSTIRSFETETANDKVKIPRVDKIIDSLTMFVNACDLTGLREFWQILSSQLFSRLESTQIITVKKMETYLYRWYLCNAIQTHRAEKVNEFFEIMTPELFNQPEWKDWFAIVFIKNPTEHQIFGKYFNKVWVDTFLLSLQNFLSVVTYYMPLPAILNHGEAASKIKYLTAENEKYRNMMKSGKIIDDTEDLLSPTRAVLMNEIVDDFATLSQEPYSRSGSVSHTSQPVNVPIAKPLFNQSRSLENPSKLIHRYSLPVTSDDVSRMTVLSASGDRNAATSITSTASSDASPSEKLGSTLVDDTATVTKSDSTAQLKSATKITDKNAHGSKLAGDVVDSSKKLNTFSEVSFLLVSQEEYHEHSRPIIYGQFSNKGQHVATLDADGVVKVWTPQPPVETTATVMSKAKFTCLDWSQGRDNLLLLGCNTSTVRLFDIKEKKNVIEKNVGDDISRIMSLSSSANGFVLSARHKQQVNGRVASLSLWDLKTMTSQKQFSIGGAGVCVTCFSFNHNYQLLITGANDGIIRLFVDQCSRKECKICADLSSAETVAMWQAHNGEIQTVQFCPAETSVYSMGKDDRLVQWSLTKTHHIIMEMNLVSADLLTSMSTSVPSSGQLSYGKVFSLDSSGHHLLAIARNSGIIYKVQHNPPALERSLALYGHKSAVTALDWISLSNSVLCFTGAADGTAVISSLMVFQ